MRLIDRRRPRRWLAAVALGGLLAARCGGPPPLTETAPSADALMREVLDALAQRDRARLEALAVTEAEFREVVWDHLPAARPERNLPRSYVWGDLHQKSGASLVRTLNEAGGRTYDLLAVRFETSPEPYGPFTIHRGTTLRVRPAGGEPVDLQVCGSLIEQNGRWKVFSYVTSD